MALRSVRQSQQGGGIFGVGRSRAKLYNEERPSTTFADVAGADEAKADLREEIDFLREPQRYLAIGAHIPKGVLLVGPPGTGKTLLARAVAGEAGVPFYSASGTDFVELFVGSEPAACAISLIRPRKTLRASSSSMKSTPLGAHAVAPPLLRATTSGSRPWSNCWWKWRLRVQSGRGRAGRHQ